MLERTQEPVRLVIWDLDETYWNGTLTEGGITLRNDTRDIVIQLAQRGIVSSICSKNNFDKVKKVLEDDGIWDYFVFPSISWEPKGPRIAAQVDAFQLRPATIMFIDDNRLNLEEVKSVVPDIQIQLPDFIPGLLSSSLFKGKNDKDLSRLKQYQLMERRKTDELSKGGDVREFLRESNIRVTFNYDLRNNISRVIELINRTNQLNFTKTRLLGTDEQIQKEALELVSRHDVQGALIQVSDRYGDHGYCGLYVLDNSRHLIHFAFSCRILGMQVETWLYKRLDSPKLDIRGEVLTNPKIEDSPIDWIQESSSEQTTNPDSNQELRVAKIIARGGCDLQAAIHYLAPLSSSIIGEFNYNGQGKDQRIDHSIFCDKESRELRMRRLPPLAH